MSNSIKHAVIMTEILVYSCNASLMISGLKFWVHSEQKKLGVLLKDVGFANLGHLMCILGNAGLYT